MPLPILRDAAPVGSCLNSNFNASSPTGRRLRQETQQNPIKLEYEVKNKLFQLKTTGPRRRVDGARGRPARLNRSCWASVGTAWLKMSTSSRRGARPFRRKRAKLYCGTSTAYCEGRPAWPACLGGVSLKARLTRSTSSWRRFAVSTASPRKSKSRVPVGRRRRNEAARTGNSPPERRS